MQPVGACVSLWLQGSKVAYQIIVNVPVPPLTHTPDLG